jgi:hypothetical protein
MIDPHKSVIILSHPRSGSTWFQWNLQHKNLWELFNWGISFEYTDTNIKFLNNKNHYVKPDIIYERIDAFTRYEKLSGPVSAKYHTLDYDAELIKFFIEKKLQVVSITRNNLSDVIWSYCIAVETNEWLGKIKTQTLIITRKKFDSVINMLQNCRKNLNTIKQQVNTIDIVYEDLLKIRKSTWWGDHNIIPIQDGKNTINIINRDEVAGWITELDLNNFYSEC